MLHQANSLSNVYTKKIFNMQSDSKAQFTNGKGAQQGKNLFI